jgi:hypothetical protein
VEETEGKPPIWWLHCRGLQREAGNGDFFGAGYIWAVSGRWGKVSWGQVT